jgi:hypothetical protein
MVVQNVCDVMHEGANMSCAWSCECMLLVLKLRISLASRLQIWIAAWHAVPCKAQSGLSTCMVLSLEAQ